MGGRIGGDDRTLVRCDEDLVAGDAAPGTFSAGQSVAQVAASPSGAAEAVWTVGSPGVAQAIQASYRPAEGGAWQPPTTLFASRTQAVYSPSVGVDDHGDAFALWDDGAVHLAEDFAGTSGWSRPEVLKAGGLAGFAVSPGGALIVAWERHLSGGTGPNSPSRSLLYVRVRPPGSRSWLPMRSLGVASLYGLQGDGPPGTYFPGPRMAINASGTVFVTWQWLHHGNFYPRTAILPATDRWRPRIVTLPTPGLNPAIAGDARGLATVLWDPGLNQRGPAYVREAEVSPRGRVLAMRKLGQGSESVIAEDGEGAVVAGWSGYGAVLRPAARLWCPRLELADSNEMAVAIATDGVAQVVWHHGSNTGTNTAMMATTLTGCRP